MLSQAFDPIFVRSLRKREGRAKTGLTIVEGYPEVKRAYDAGVPFEKLYICPELITLSEGEFCDIDYDIISKEEFASIAFGARLKGILALCKPDPVTLDNIRLPANPLVIILEGVEKPGNLGAVVRTCDGAGIDALIMTEGKTDVYNHNVVRSSIGTIFTVPTISAGNEDTYRVLKSHGCTIFAATAHTDAFYTQCDLSKATAIVIGNEHQGLSDFWLTNADAKIKIPMKGIGQCLNAAVSASILTYEAVRQRQ